MVISSVREFLALTNDWRRKIMKQKQEFMTNTVVVCIGALICCAFWGSAFPCIKLGYQFFQIDSADTATQILFAGCRFALAGMLTIIMGSILTKQWLFPRKQSLPLVMKLSIFQTILQYLLFYIGLAHTTGVKSSIIVGTNVFVSIVVASLIFRQEKMTMAKAIGCLIGFIGVVIVNLNGSGFDMNMSFVGEGCVFLSTVAYACSSVLIKDYSKKENPVVLSGYQFLLGGLVMIACGLAAGGRLVHVTGAGMAMLFYLGLLSAVAYTLWGILLKYNPVSKVSVFGFMNPIFGVVLSAWLLQEGDQAFGWKSVIALILVCIGIFIVNKNWKKKTL